MLLRTTHDGSAFSLIDFLAITYDWNKNVSAHRLKRYLCKNEYDHTKIFKTTIKSRGVSRTGTWFCNDRAVAYEICRQIKDGMGELRGKYKKSARRVAGADNSLAAPAPIPDTEVAPLDTTGTILDDLTFVLDEEENIGQYAPEHDEWWNTILL